MAHVAGKLSKQMVDPRSLSRLEGAFQDMKERIAALDTKVSAIGNDVSSVAATHAERKTAVLQYLPLTSDEQVEEHLGNQTSR